MMWAFAELGVKSDAGNRPSGATSTAGSASGSVAGSSAGSGSDGEGSGDRGRASGSGSGAEGEEAEGTELAERRSSHAHAGSGGEAAQADPAPLPELRPLPLSLVVAVEAAREARVAAAAPAGARGGGRVRAAHGDPGRPVTLYRYLAHCFVNDDTASSSIRCAGAGGAAASGPVPQECPLGLLGPLAPPLLPHVSTGVAPPPSPLLSSWPQLQPWLRLGVRSPSQSFTGVHRRSQSFSPCPPSPAPRAPQLRRL